MVAIEFWGSPAKVKSNLSWAKPEVPGALHEGEKSLCEHEAGDPGQHFLHQSEERFHDAKNPLNHAKGSLSVRGSIQNHFLY